MAQLFQDSLALDGVSCVACHQQSPTVGHTFSGVMAFDSAMIYGQYGAGKTTNLLEDPTMEYVGTTLATVPTSTVQKSARAVILWSPRRLTWRATLRVLTTWSRPPTTSG